MVFPEGKPIYKNLKTKYVRLEDLVKELKDEKFSGFVALDFEDGSGSILFSGGNIVGAVSDFPSEDPVIDLMRRSKSPGVINVSALPHEIIVVVSSCIDGDVVWKDFPAWIVSFDDLLSYIEDSGMTGAIDIVAKKEGIKATIYFFEGAIVEFVIEEFGVLKTKEMARSRITEIFKEKGTYFTVIREKYKKKVDFDPLALKRDIVDFFSEIYRSLSLSIGEKQVKLTFRKIFLELTEKYPFLDPFDPMVYFEDGRLVVSDEVEPAEFVESMKAVIELLKKEEVVNFKMLESIYREMVSSKAGLNAFKQFFD